MIRAALVEAEKENHFLMKDTLIRMCMIACSMTSSIKYFKSSIFACGNQLGTATY